MTGAISRHFRCVADVYTTNRVCAAANVEKGEENPSSDVRIDVSLGVWQMTILGESEGRAGILQGTPFSR
jgi:hypothetical protein